MSTETVNGTALTFDKSGQAMFPELTAGASAHLARISALQESEQDLTETEAALSERCSVFLANLKKKTDPNGLSTRMLRECCRAIEGGLPFHHLGNGRTGVRCRMASVQQQVSRRSAEQGASVYSWTS